METYSVNFEGFEPSCGWPYYRYIENEHLPALRAEVERWRKLRDSFVGEFSTLKQFNADLETLAKCRGALIAKLQTKFFEGRAGAEILTLDELLSLGVKEAKQDGENVETSRTWPELSTWLEEAKLPIEQIGLYCKYASERADCGRVMFESCFESSAIDIRFWELTLELQKAHWVFEKAELKYKTKICRELVKMLGEYIAACSEQLGRYHDEEKKSTSELYRDIKQLFDDAQEDLAYYRQIKADIASFGVEEALRHSSRRVTQPIAYIDKSKVE